MTPTHLPNSDLKRIGFHYFADTRHYRQIDLETWLPRLVELGASWLTLPAPAERAIPESFINGLLSAGIQPVLHFCLSKAQPPALDTLRLLLRTYARWGVRQVAFYDRPNVRESWPASVWAQNYLVERFLDEFIPLARAAQEIGLMVITPPLEPGGDYWDLAFLRSMLRGIQRRGCLEIVDALAIGAYAWINNRLLDWGLGGSSCWPGARPYHTPVDQQDHMGFRIFDWYLEICQEELGYRLPVYLLRAGQRMPTGLPAEQLQAARLSHARLNLSAAQWMAGDPRLTDTAVTIPEEVKACNFWLLAAEEDHPVTEDRWYLPSGERLPTAEAVRQWVAYVRRPQEVLQPSEPAELVEMATDLSIGNETKHGQDSCAEIENGKVAPSSEIKDAADPVNRIIEAAKPGLHPISHYVLLPLYAWGVANWDLALVEPLLQEFHPAIGFSLAEARLAKRVTVVGADGAISAEALAMLRQTGCQVDRLLEDGTLIAT
jgi:hypothetical protein